MSLVFDFSLFSKPEEDFLKRGQARVVDFDLVYPEKAYIFESFSERLWAYLTIQQLLENR